MKFLIAFILIFTTLLSAESDKAKKSRIEKQIKKEIQKEKKYAKEQTFYQNDNYNFKAAEVNPDSIDSVPEIPVDDFDMDSVYD